MGSDVVQHKLAEAIWRLFHLGECFSFRKPFGPLPAEVLAKAVG
ncbi:MAG: hypothetical protein O2894_13415 [Planctomycetota bacterium]|nr:hypothetical protein [Planctomycetota bacterium]